MRKWKNTVRVRTSPCFHIKYHYYKCPYTYPQGFLYVLFPFKPLLLPLCNPSKTPDPSRRVRVSKGSNFSTPTPTPHKPLAQGSGVFKPLLFTNCACATLWLCDFATTTDASCHKYSISSSKNRFSKEIMSWIWQWSLLSFFLSPFIKVKSFQVQHNATQSWRWCKVVSRAKDSRQALSRLPWCYGSTGPLVVQGHWHWWSSEHEVGLGVRPVLMSVIKLRGVLGSRCQGSVRREDFLERRLFFGMMRSWL